MPWGWGAQKSSEIACETPSPSLPAAGPLLSPREEGFAAPVWSDRTREEGIQTSERGTDRDKGTARQGGRRGEAMCMLLSNSAVRGPTEET